MTVLVQGVLKGVRYAVHFINKRKKFGVRSHSYRDMTYCSWYTARWGGALRPDRKKCASSCTDTGRLLGSRCPHAAPPHQWYVLTWSADYA